MFNVQTCMYFKRLDGGRGFHKRPLPRNPIFGIRILRKAGFPQNTVITLPNPRGGRGISVIV
jgi:hypothetical protein